MFAISGKLACEVGHGGANEVVLAVITKLPEVEAVVHLLGTSYGLQAWFQGLQQPTSAQDQLYGNPNMFLPGQVSESHQTHVSPSPPAPPPLASAHFALHL